MRVDVSRFSVQTEVVFGIGSTGLVGAEAKKLGAGRVLFVTDAGVKNAGVLEQAFESLHNTGVDSILFDESPQDPDTQTIQQLVPLLKENDCNCVVAAGGGSAMCTGKGVALMATNPGNIRDYAGIDRFRNPPLPCIAIPTTAGSGSEVSKFTIVTDERTKHKMSIGGIQNAPNLAILDPLLLRSVPRQQALAAGVDALTHAIEAYCSNQATPLTDCIALAAIAMISRNFCVSVLTDDLEAKSCMLLASTMSNIACGNAGLGLVHAINGAITSFYKLRGYSPVPYGLIHAICLPIVLRFNLPACERKLASMASALELNEKGEGSGKLARKVIERIKQILLTLDAPRKLPWQGLGHEDMEEMAKITLESPVGKPNPRNYREEDLTCLFEQALQGWDRD